MIVLKTNQIYKRFQLGEHVVEALSGIDFNVEKGEFVAIMGPSGSGKSTLLHILGGLDTPSSGQVFLVDRNLSDLGDRESTLVRRHNVGFVFQFLNLLPTLTAEENILLPLVIDGKDPKKNQEHLENILELVSLKDRRHHKPDQLSGGQQQRVAIARALITKPAILLADEPTGNLDTKTGIVIMELLQRSSNDLEQTIIVVTHDPKAASYADRVVFLKDGVITQELILSEDMVPSKRFSSIMETMEALEV